MALGMSFYSVVIPISNFEKCKDIKSLKEAMERTPVIGARTHDDYLFKESVMGTYGVEMLVDFWKSQGLTPYVEINNKIQWKDLCVVEAHSGATGECDWLEYDRETISVWLKGKPKGEIIRSTNR